MPHCSLSVLMESWQLNCSAIVFNWPQILLTSFISLLHWVNTFMHAQEITNMQGLQIWSCKAHQTDYIAFPAPFWPVNLVQCVLECMWLWLYMNVCISLSSCQTPPQEPTHKLHFLKEKKTVRAREMEKETKIKPVMCIQVTDLTLLLLHLLEVPGFICSKIYTLDIATMF